MLKSKLGAKYKCKISGFVGVANGRAEWLNGCETVSLTPPVDKDGKKGDPHWFDLPQLEFVEQVVEVGDQSTGGPKPPARQTTGV